MGVVASKGDNNKTPLLNLCKERKGLIRAARDARYHLAKSHLLYFRSLLNFSNALNQFVHKDLTVITYSSDDDSSDLMCSRSDLDSDSDSDSDCLVCDLSDSDSQTDQLSNNDDQNQQKPGNGTCSSSNNVQESMEKPREGLGFSERGFVSAPIEDEMRGSQKPVFGDGTCGSSKIAQESMEKPREGLGFSEREFLSVPIEDEMRGSQKNSSIKQDSFTGYDIFGLYNFLDNTQCIFVQPDQRDDQIESDGLSEIREREGIPEMEPESDHNSLIRKNQKKKKKQRKKKNVQESSPVASEIDKRYVEANTINGQVAGEADKSNETCEQETEKTPEIDAKEVTGSYEGTCDEAYESSSSSFSESSGSGLTDLRNIVKKINCICEKAVSYSEVSELLEVNKIVHHQPLGSQFKGFASRVLGSIGNPMGNSLPKRVLPADDLAGSLSMALGKLCMWENKLYAEVTVEEKLRFSYEKAYKTLKNLDEKGAESSEISEAGIVVKLQLSKINVSVRAVKSVSMRIQKIRDEELLFQVIEIINGFRKMWRFLAKCHHKQFRAIARSKSCVHIVEKGSSSRKTTQQVEEKIRRYRESLRGYIDAQRSFVKLLNEWLRRNIMEDDETEIEAPEIFRVCSEWLREIENVDEIKVLSVVEEMRLKFRGLGLKQVEEEKQRMRTERLCKELERKTKELEEIWGTTVVFPASESGPKANMRAERLCKDITTELEEIWGPVIYFPASESGPTAEMRRESLCKDIERKKKKLEEICGTVVFSESEFGPKVNMIVEPELLSLRKSVTQEREKHERMIRELNDAVSMSLQECLVPVFEALEEFCFANFKAYRNIRIVSIEEH